MPQVIKIALLGLLLMAIASGCGDPNNAASPFNIDKGTHPSGWLPSGHAIEAGQDVQTCRECHGADLSGGIAKTAACTECHIGSETKAHPLDWVSIQDVQTKHPQYVVANGDSSCRNIYCHGGNLEGVAASGPNCNACHVYP